MNESGVKYYGNNSSALQMNDPKAYQLGGYPYQSPSIKLKSKSPQESFRIERPTSTRMRIEEASASSRVNKNQYENPVNITEKKNNFNMTFFNLSKVRDKEQLKSSDINKNKELVAKQPSYSAKKPNEKTNDKLVFYNPMGKPKKPEENKPDYSNHPSSRQNSRVFSQEKNESFDKKQSSKNAAISQKELVEMLNDSALKPKNVQQVNNKNFPYIVQTLNKNVLKNKAATAHPSNNSSFQEEEKPRNFDQYFKADDMKLRVSINHEEQGYKPMASYQKEADGSKRHRRGLSMGQYPFQDNTVDPSRQIKYENSEKEKVQLQMQYNQSHPLQYQNYQIPTPQTNNASLLYQQQQQEKQLQQQQYQQMQMQMQLQQQQQQQQLAQPQKEQQEQDDYYAQFFHTHKMTFDFERAIISQRYKNPTGPSAPPNSQQVHKRSHHVRTSSVGDDPTMNLNKTNSRWAQKRSSLGDQPILERDNSDLLELITLRTETRGDSTYQDKQGDLFSNVIENKNTYRK